MQKGGNGLQISGKLKKFTVLIPIFLILAIFFSIMHKNMNKKERVYMVKDDFSSFGIVLDKTVHELGIEGLRIEAVPEREFMMKNYGERDMFEVKRRLTALRDKTYVPFIKPTVVFAVDRTRVNENIDSWKSLIDSDYKVLFSSLEEDLGVSSLLAMNISLGYNEKNLSHAEEVFKEMEKDGRIGYLNEYKEDDMNLINISKPEEYPIMVLWDYQAAYIKSNVNENFDLIVPKDGTLTTTMGMMSTSEKGRESDEFFRITKFLKSEEGQKLLADNEYRTIHEDANIEIYPDEESYSSAVEIKDYNAWNTTLNRFYRARTYPNIRIKLILLSTFIVFWSFYGLKRLPDNNISKYCSIEAFMLIFWASIRYAESIPSFYEVREHLSYLYYIPMNVMSLVFYYIFYLYRNRDVEDIPRKNFIVTVSITAIFIIIAVTNGFHGVFITPNTETGGVYKYQPMYYLNLLWIITLVCMGIYHMNKVLFRRNKKFLSAVFLMYFAIVALYIAAHSKGIIELNITLSMIIIIIIGMELKIRYLLFENQFMDMPFFQKSNNIMVIFNDKLDIVYMSNNGEKLRKYMTRELLAQKMEYLDGPRFILDRDMPERYFGKLYRGMNGYIMMLEDMTKIYELNRELNNKNIELRNKHKLLSKERNVREELASLRVSVNLMNNIEYAIEDNLKNLKVYLKDLYDGKNVKYNADHIYMLCRYIKQRAQMSVLAMKNEKMNKERTLKVLNDLVDEFKNKEFDFFIVIAGDEEISVSSLIEIHQFFYSLLKTYYRYENSSMFCRLVNSKDSVKIVVNMNMDASDMLDFTSKIDRMQEKFKRRIKLTNDEEDMILEYEIPKEEGEDIGTL